MSGSYRTPVKLFFRLILSFLLLFALVNSAAYAADTTKADESRSLLPGIAQEAKFPVKDLPREMQSRFSTSEGMILISNCRQLKDLKQMVGPALHGKYLASKIRCGLMQMGDIPYYIKHALEFFIWLAGTVAVIMVMVGGYQYAIGGITENKEQGKKTITAALIGLMVTLVAWVIINVVQAIITAPSKFSNDQVSEILSRFFS